MLSMFPRSTFFEARLEPDSAPLASGYDAVVAFVNDDCSAKTLQILSDGGVKMIAMRCAGYDRVDLRAASELGITVARVPTYSPQSVAEHAVALMFTLCRNMHRAYNRVKMGNYALSGLVGFQLYKKIVGVVGTGAIGQEACRILKGIGCKVIAYDVKPNPAVEAMGIEYMPLDEMLPLCDIVTLHCPLLPSTRHIINKDRLAIMKPGALLVNVSRGGLVDSDALPDALRSGQLGALGLDVYESEDSLFFNDFTQLDVKDRMQFWDERLQTIMNYPQVLVSPHSAFLTYEALDAIATDTLHNIDRYFKGQSLGPNEVVYTPK